MCMILLIISMVLKISFEKANYTIIKSNKLKFMLRVNCYCHIMLIPSTVTTLIVDLQRYEIPQFLQPGDVETTKEAAGNYPATFQGIQTCLSSVANSSIHKWPGFWNSWLCFKILFDCLLVIVDVQLWIYVLINEPNACSYECWRWKNFYFCAC